MSNDPIAPNVDVLNSWKEVAIYLGRGIRTVQRWEMDLGLASAAAARKIA